MAIALERDSALRVSPERKREVPLIPVPQLDFTELARRTKGEYVEQVGGLIVWAPKDGVANGKLRRETRGSHRENTRTSYYLKSEKYSDEVSDYVAVFNDDGSVALIDAINPITNTILGFVIKEGNVDRIMGNESKFADSNPEYITARNQGWEAILEAAKINN